VKKKLNILTSQLPEKETRFLIKYKLDPVYTSKFRLILGEISSKKIDLGQV